LSTSSGCVTRPSYTVVIGGGSYIGRRETDVFVIGGDVV
jgi:hypothetical protein